MTDASSPRCFALLPCAGVGARSGAAMPKQYVEIAGSAMVAHTLAALARVPRLAATLAVLSPDDDQFESHVPGFTGARGWVCRRGGAQRADTVAQGLEELLERGALPHDWVLVHDAARCLVRPEWVDRLIDACLGDAVGGLLALPVADTLKQAEGGRVAATLSRVDKWSAQTPQMFRLGMLREALRAAGTAVTDDSSAIEAQGLRPLLVEGDSENLKVTWPSDFMLAERVLAARAKGTP
ncbi:2-C-methyl-D-erythritol 4-phosphate cytidylyltransferase [Rhizobacter sp. AJA081-3]|uniref:2-C-methyl-D-erythritol 4-phosphate cytidylyltransferase n=1 Tax=Rhizobacter sp. AJA081-3 TaxID=2753607 RepID=UPI001ADFF43A|nr:2-C-methyl-D-erythritol 4-phosphate cytidylyltransferase [Rhizobacter sp. AJA081-3]QTN25046.1 2-C-methyl-D-erythritol 4-phosphate cytidylyltransferase [Rhizobacter sp. AJA081-3]